MSTESEIIDAVTGLVKTVPVYEDLAQPAAKELGKSLETVAKAVNVALAPVSALIWGYDQIRDFIATKVTERLKNVPPENVVAPKPNVAGPAIESLRYTGHEPLLSDLYANLLATAMDKDTANGAHPAFVEIIKQLTSDEAKLIGQLLAPIPLPLISVRWEYKTPTPEKNGGQDALINFSLLGSQASLEFPDLTPTYIDNLCRLGLIEFFPHGMAYTENHIYEALENTPQIQDMKFEIERNPELRCVLVRKGLSVTELGKQFINSCVNPKN